MAFKAIIRQGDRTSHGGTVVEAHQLLIFTVSLLPGWVTR